MKMSFKYVDNGLAGARDYSPRAGAFYRQKRDKFNNLNFNASSSVTPITLDEQKTAISATYPSASAL
ncbi:hypothetical protein [Enterovibrio calviensis]|uniref:hypothetical protein n=1 Tax=Enterovibrio calviensis TaxID=91359 RepID=UPI0012DD4A1B|nr:hypothetical protein [Enterovibrio calviensis]